ncbi:MAG: hypothetical protein UIL37_02265, partial [Clostridia bacterium]|nr:hypothetical protein [Clostridia bacterium]
ASWGSTNKVAATAVDDLKNLTNGVTFTDGVYQVNYSGGFPKLWWEENPRPTYSVSVASSIANGTVTLSADSVYVGESVNVTAAPSEGYMLTAIKANGENIWPTVAGETSTASQTITHTPTEATEYSATFEPVPAEDPNAYSGAGTEADPYLIGTAGQLKKFRDDVNAGMCGSVTEAVATVAVSNPKYVYVKLTDDIDLGGASWTPIGNATATFRGSFDGNGHKITNFKLDTATTNVRIGTNSSYSSTNNGTAYCTVDTHNLYGLFATVDDLYHKDTKPRGIVKNLGVENVTITTATGDTPNKAGAIIARTSAHASVENCYAKNVTATLNGNNQVYFGGLLGYAEQFYKMAGCYVDTLNVTVNTTGGTQRVAALSTRTNGGASAIVTDCYSANVTYTKASTCTTTPNITNTTFGVNVAGGATYTNVYSTMDLTTYTTGWNTGAYQSGDANASWGSTNKVAATAVDDLKNLTNGVTFTNGVYNKSNSGGFPKLSWEANPYGYTFSATQSTGGTITLDKTTATVAAAGAPVDVTVTVTPDANYSVKAIKANGSVIWSAGSESAVTHTYTATASTEFTAVFEIPLDPGLGKYIDPAYTAGFSSVNTGSPAGTTTNYGQYSWSAPTANSAGSPFTKPENGDGFFTLAPATTGTKVHGFAVQNIQYNQYQSLKSTVDTYIRLNQIDGTDLSTLENGATMAEFVFGGNVVSADYWKGVSLRLVKDTDSSTGYSWGLYYTSNYSTETGYREVGNTRIEAPADIFGVWYHVVYDIDTTIGQARATITPEGGTAAVIEACSTGFVYTMEQANARITVSKDNADGTANLSAFNHGKSSVGFNGFVTIDLKQHYIIQEHFFHIDDIATTIDGGNISATADMYGIKSIYSGNETATTPPIYIAVYDNSKQMVGVAKGQIVKESISGGMRYTPTATLDAAALKLANGTYTVKVMLWSDKQVPYRAVAEKTLTVNGGTYTLN